MALDLSGTTLGSAIAAALALPEPPTDPTDAQLVSYNAAVAAQLTTWMTIAQVILTYISTNAVITSSATTVIAPPGTSGGPCTGIAVGSIS